MVTMCWTSSKPIKVSFVGLPIVNVPGWMNTPPEFSLLKLDLGLVYFSFRDSGSAGARARAANAIGIQVSLVDGSAAAVSGEADTGNIQQLNRTYRPVNTLPGIVRHRAYGRWITQRGLTVVEVMPGENLMLVRGAVPGPRGGVVEVRSDAR